MDKKKAILCLIGHAGAGKTSTAHWMEMLGVPECVSHTTRPARINEVDGKHYYFTDEEVFERDEFVERETYDGHLYGLSRSEIDRKFKQSRIISFVCTYKGYEQVKAGCPDVKVLAIKVEGGSAEELCYRMRMRGDHWKRAESRSKMAKTDADRVDCQKYDVVFDNTGCRQDQPLQVGGLLLYLGSLIDEGRV